MNLLVFVTGAIVLVLEILATRILSPYFGNTLYTISSVISVVLGALSLGYYLGGRLADSHPKFSWFYGLITLGGAFTLATRLLMVTALPYFGTRLPLDFGPLISSMILFFLPSFVLGCLSPFAIKLALLQNPNAGAGRTSGSIFFWSTAGSIAGSLSAGFILIPLFGLDRIVSLCSLLLLLIGLVGLLSTKTISAKTTFLLVPLVVLAYSLSQAFTFKLSNVVYSQDGLYEKISVVDTTLSDRPTRILLQDKSASAAMYLDSDDLVFDYTKYANIYLSSSPKPKRALALGGGAYSVPKALLAGSPNLEIDIAEIEPALIPVAQKYFFLPDNPRLHHFITDGRRFLTTTPYLYDLIFGDVYFSFSSIPPHFVTKEFFTLAKSRLTSSGMFIGNFIGSLDRTTGQLTFSIMRTFQSVFPQSYFFAVNSPKSPVTQNIIFIGLPDLASLDLAHPLVTPHLSHRVDPRRFDLTSYPYLSDNYSPVEFLTSRLLAPPSTGLSGSRAIAYIFQQSSFGSRHLSSPGHAKIQDFLQAELSALADSLTVQDWIHENHSLKNFLARFQPNLTRRVLIATHYDTLKDNPGANNGASGVAVLLELASVLANSPWSLPFGIDLAFFDGEEGQYSAPQKDPSWKPLGSSYFAQSLSKVYPSRFPESAIVIDMVCDKHLDIYQERNSLQASPQLVKQVWAASDNKFISSPKYAISNDHTPLSAAKIPSILVIDFDYPYYNNTEDTPNKCSPQSLAVVGQTLLTYLYSL